MDAVMYGEIPIAKIVNCENAEPDIKLMKSDIADS